MNNETKQDVFKDVLNTLHVNYSTTQFTQSEIGKYNLDGEDVERVEVPNGK